MSLRNQIHLIYSRTSHIFPSPPFSAFHGFISPFLCGSLILPHPILLLCRYFPPQQQEMQHLSPHLFPHLCLETPKALPGEVDVYYYHLLQSLLNLMLLMCPPLHRFDQLQTGLSLLQALLELPVATHFHSPS